MTVFALTSCGLFSDSESKNKDEKITIETDTDATSAQATDIWDDESVENKINDINALIDQYYYFDVDRDKQE